MGEPEHMENEECPFCLEAVEESHDLVLVETGIGQIRQFWYAHRACIIGRPELHDCPDCRAGIEHTHD
jgi:hypothetical protein